MGKATCKEWRCPAGYNNKNLTSTETTENNCCQADICDESQWPDVDHGTVCGDCMVLVHNFDTKYKTCDGYCQAVGMECKGAWEEHNDKCIVKKTMTCTETWSSSDAICECVNVC